MSAGVKSHNVTDIFTIVDTAKKQLFRSVTIFVCSYFISDQYEIYLTQILCIASDLVSCYSMDKRYQCEFDEIDTIFCFRYISSFYGVTPTDVRPISYPETSNSIHQNPQI